MTEIEVPIEQAQEDIHHAAHHSDGPWQKVMSRAAVLSAFLAVFAAISALFAGHYANDAMIEQIQSSNQWSYYQAKGIKLSLAELKQQLDPKDESVAKKIEKYKEEQEKIKETAEEKTHEAEFHLKKHESLATCVTLFQIAIAMTAIGVLTKKKTFLLGSGGLGMVGVLWLIKTFLLM